MKINIDYNSGMSGLSRMEKGVQKMKERLKKDIKKIEVHQRDLRKLRQELNKNNREELVKVAEEKKKKKISIQ